MREAKATKYMSIYAEETKIVASDCAADAATSSIHKSYDSELQDLPYSHEGDKWRQTWEIISQSVLNLLENKEVEGNEELVKLSKKFISMMVDFCTVSAESRN